MLKEQTILSNQSPIEDAVREQPDFTTDHFNIFKKTVITGNESVPKITINDTIRLFS